MAIDFLLLWLVHIDTRFRSGQDNACRVDLFSKYKCSFYRPAKLIVHALERQRGRSIAKVNNFDFLAFTVVIHQPMIINADQGCAMWDRIFLFDGKGLVIDFVEHVLLDKQVVLIIIAKDLLVEFRLQGVKVIYFERGKLVQGEGIHFSKRSCVW